MQTEEQYYLIDQLLKGKLDNNEQLLLKNSFSNQKEYEKELEIHRLAGQAIEENYFLDVRSHTKNVIAKNKNSGNTGKLAIGSILVAAILVGYLYFPKENETEHVRHSTIKESPVLPQTTFNTSKPKQENKQSAEPNTKSISSTKPNPNLTISKTDSALPVSRINPTDLEFPTQTTISKNREPKIQVIESETASGTITKNIEDDKTILKPLPSKEKDIELALYPERDGSVKIPMSDDFSGELLIFDINGNPVFRQLIINGAPNYWDGTTSSIGIASSGQYGFTLTSREGIMEARGYITVIK